MSRTYRFKSNGRHRFLWNLEWHLRDHDSDAIHPPLIDPKSKEGKKRIARYHADHYNRFKEPGPHWFRNLTTERPQRRNAKAQLHRIVQGDEFEVIVNAKDPLDYWT